MRKGSSLELWMVGSKALVLLYVIAATYFESPGERSPWVILYVLAYLSFNLLVLVLPYDRIRQGFSSFYAPGWRSAQPMLILIFCSCFPLTPSS
ncbi:hypothetical protein N6H14_01465 [Paenibacillus sp. CC-CFT747]|nr:hypothetical protein N6H14_01465 [Paenibacillus sp. CC-CFT747]